MFRIAQVPYVCVCVCVEKRKKKAAGYQKCAIKLYQHPDFHYGPKIRLLSLFFFFFSTFLPACDDYSATLRCQVNKYCSQAGGANMSSRSGPW